MEIRRRLLELQIISLPLQVFWHSIEIQQMWHTIAIVLGLKLSRNFQYPVEIFHQVF